jgi:methyl-accepting chemotaxis protein
MKVKKLRVEDNRLLVTLADREVTLSDGIYIGPEGQSVTVVDGEVSDLVVRLDVESASLDEIKSHMTDLTSRLSEVSDDAQLANVGLQSMLQKQQQTLQMMSNISKMIHDTAMAVIRRIGG